MGAVKNHWHDEICNRCETCGVQLSEWDTVRCDEVLCPIPEPDKSPTERTGVANNGSGDTR